MSAVTGIEDSLSDLAVSKTYALAPSKYGMYVSLDCDLYLRRATVKSTAKGKAKNAVSERMQKRGSEWEVRICAHLVDVCSRSSTKKYTDCTDLNFKDFLNRTLTSDATHLVHHLYQVTLDPEIAVIPEPLKQAGVTISRIIPDLLKLERKSLTSPWVLTVIDAKSSLNMKQSHQAQVAFYAYFLERIFQTQISSGKLSMASTGYIWLQPSRGDAEITSTIQEFQLNPWLQLLQQHLSGDIPRALAGSIEDVPWHLNSHCASCPYVEDCRAPKAYGMDIRALPDVSRADSLYLQSVSVKYAAEASRVAARGKKSSTEPAAPHPYAVSTLRAALQAQSSPGDLRAARILGTVRSDGLLASVLDDRLVVKDFLCGTLPAQNQGVSVYLSLSCDPAHDLPFAYGLLAVSADGAVLCEQREHAEWTENAAQLCAREQALLVSFLTCLSGLLAGSAIPAGSPVQIYVWDGLEKYCLTQLIIKALCGEYSQLLNALPNVRRDLYFLALAVLDFPDRWNLPSPPGVTAEAAKAAAPRVCEVTAAYRSLVFLPSPGFLQAADVHAWVVRNASAGKGTTGVPGISAESLEQGWQSRGEVRAVIQSRLQALQSATTYLRRVVTAHKPGLLYNPAAALPNRLQAQSQYQSAAGNAVAQRLMFMKQVDTLVRCSAARLKRIAVLNTGTDLVRLRCIKEAPKDVHWFVQENGAPVFPNGNAAVPIKKFCLVRDNEALVSQFSDYQYATEMHSCSDYSYRFVNVTEVATEDVAGVPTRVVKIAMKSVTFLTTGQAYILFEREVDLNVLKSVDTLTKAAGLLAPNTFVDVITAPNAWNDSVTTAGAGPTFAGMDCATLSAARVRVDAVYRDVLLLTGGSADSPYASVGPLTSVQARAFDRVLKDRLTIVWGPPGTGKTHFAAKSVLNLIEAAARCNVPQLRVLVTATTHKAIDEILGKFLTLRDTALSIPHRDDIAPWAGTHCKVCKFSSKPPDAADIVPGLQYTKGVKTMMKTKFLVVGATAWSLYKDDVYNGAFREQFDLVIVDEASQMPVADALMPLCCLRADAGGRLLVIGDTLQLPPIFAHKFGPPPAGIPPVQGSILDCLLRTDANTAVDLTAVAEGRAANPPRMLKLSDNFRMNSALSRFTSRLYGQDYTPSSLSRNGNGRWGIRAGSSRRFSTLLPGILPDAQPSTFSLPEIIAVRLVPHRASGTRSRFGAALTDAEIATTGVLEHLAAESHFTADLVEALASTNSTYSSEDAAAEQIFVCTPHNNQKAAIKQALITRNHAQWGEMADTAERMQGQERDVVIICLGVFTHEIVAKEVDFLFSKQRLNVAISRAKKTCILVYTDALVALNPAVIGNVEANLAYEHLLAFIAAAEAQGARVDVPVVL